MATVILVEQGKSLKYAHETGAQEVGYICPTISYYKIILRQLYKVL